MSDILKEARQNAVKAYLSCYSVSSDHRKQTHPRECISACLRLVAPCPNRGRVAPEEGLTWSEAFLYATTYGLYLQPILDASQLAGPVVVLGAHVSTKESDGHAYLLLMDGPDIKNMFDPAKGLIYSSKEYPQIDWTHLALVYRP